MTLSAQLQTLILVLTKQPVNVVLVILKCLQ